MAIPIDRNKMFITSKAIIQYDKLGQHGQHCQYLEYVWELIGHVHGHGAHPEEEANEGVLNTVAKKNAESVHWL